MKTPSQRKKRTKKNNSFKTQRDINLEHGIYGEAKSGSMVIGREYLTIQRRQHDISEIIKSVKKTVKKHSKKKAEEDNKRVEIKSIEKQAREKMKTQTVFDVIDIDD